MDPKSRILNLETWKPENLETWKPGNLSLLPSALTEVHMQQSYLDG